MVYAPSRCSLQTQELAEWRPAVAWRSPTGSPEQIEQDILLRELMTQLTPDESVVFTLKKAGYSSEEIARRRGSSVGAVDVLYTRVKRKIRRLVGVQE